ncbi:hypothetical protein GCM10009785_03000 [Brooklawnia cerclae]|uniref:Uncharacterized protein n=1 Tax=Brooklawnia cerclae TaxID=349934 RepID=A0ABX0SCJ7_9ACTN|nr:hypothetical protein [Brooklawnia cerclae]NIH56105.1 hypothetical protein [Brooklawnia cerclae]
MSNSTIAIIVTVAASVLAIAYLVIAWNRRRSARDLWRGVGVVAVAVGLFVTGVMEMLAQFGRTLVEWMRATAMDTTLGIGTGAVVLGVICYLIGGRITPPTRAEAKQGRIDRAIRRKPVVSTPAPRQPASPAASPGPAQGQAPAARTSDDEVTAILKKHGIE